MATITATETVSLDGVMQGIGRPDEDERGGFRHGGWAQGYTDDVIGAFMAEGMSGDGEMLFGRRTYEDLLRHWSSVTEPNPFTEHLLRVPKHVVSRDPRTTLAYPNSSLLVGEAVRTVARLREQTEAELNIIGSGELVRALHAAGLLDGYVLLVHPVVLGSGTRLFGDGERTDLQLRRSVTSTTGVIVAEYAVTR